MTNALDYKLPMHEFIARLVMKKSNNMILAESVTTEHMAQAKPILAAKIDDIKNRVAADVLANMNLPAEVLNVPNLTQDDFTKSPDRTPEANAHNTAVSRNVKNRSRYNSAINTAKNTAGKMIKEYSSQVQKVLRTCERMHGLYIPGSQYADSSDPNFSEGYWKHSAEQYQNMDAEHFNSDYEINNTTEYRNNRDAIVNIMVLAAIEKQNSMGHDATDDTQPGATGKFTYDDEKLGTFINQSAEVALGNANYSIIDVAMAHEFDPSLYTEPLLQLMDNVYNDYVSIIRNKYRGEVHTEELEVPVYGKTTLVYGDDAQDEDEFDEFEDDEATVTYAVVKYGMVLCDCVVESNGHGGGRIDVVRSNRYETNDTVRKSIESALISNLVKDGVVTDIHLLNRIRTDSDTILNHPNADFFESIDYSIHSIRYLIENDILPAKTVMVALYSILSSDDATNPLKDKASLILSNAIDTSGIVRGHNNTVLNETSYVGQRLELIMSIFGKNPYSFDETKSIVDISNVSDELNNVVEAGFGQKLTSDDLCAMYEVAASRSDDNGVDFIKNVIRYWSASEVPLPDDLMYTALNYNKVTLDTLDILESIVVNDAPAYGNLPTLVRGSKKAKFFINKYCDRRLIALLTSIGDNDTRRNTINRIKKLYSKIYGSDRESDSAFAPEDANTTSRYRDPASNYINSIEHRIGYDTPKGVLDAVTKLVDYKMDGVTLESGDPEFKEVLEQVKLAMDDDDMAADIFLLSLASGGNVVSFEYVISTLSIYNVPIQYDPLISAFSEYMSNTGDNYTMVEHLRYINKLGFIKQALADNRIYVKLVSASDNDPSLIYSLIALCHTFTDNDGNPDPHVEYLLPFVSCITHINDDATRETVLPFKRMYNLINQINRIRNQSISNVLLTNKTIHDFVNAELLYVNSRGNTESEGYEEFIALVTSVAFVSYLGADADSIMGDVFVRAERALYEAVRDCINGNKPGFYVNLVQKLMGEKSFQEQINGLPYPITDDRSPVWAYVMYAKYDTGIPLDTSIFGMKIPGLIQFLKQRGHSATDLEKVCTGLGIKSYMGGSKASMVDSKSTSLIQSITIGPMTWSESYYNGDGTHGVRSQVNANISLMTADEAMAAIPGGWHIPTYDEFAAIEPMIGNTMHFTNTGYIDGDGTFAESDSGCFWRQPTDGEDGLQISMVHGTELRQFEVDDPTGCKAAVRLIHD